MLLLLFIIGYVLLVIAIVASAVKALKLKRWRWQEIVGFIGLVLIAVVVIIFLARVGWIGVLKWLGITESNANLVQALATIFAGLVALGGVVSIVWQLKIAERSLRQAARASLDVVRTEHNWKLFEYKVDPGLPGLPSWAGNEEYWKWRIVHLDHLNLLHTQWIYWRSGAIGDEEINGWIGWAELLLGELQNDRQQAIKKLTDKEPAAEPETRKIMQFEETSPRLKALLHISELHNWDLFPHDFVTWLLDKCNFRSLGLSEKSSG